ncbi:uncharacterized protein LOC134690369 isoform X2 [Mytilus trossulus]|uniref:uncharacterized protein LOC134690369 isoform X2 n=1 Tax=Mytilus trossulus TaxID=6551 RepID=UPI0030062D36
MNFDGSIFVFILIVYSFFTTCTNVHRIGENNDTKWFPGTDIPSRSSNYGSDLNNAKLVLNLHSNAIKESDNGVYKCKINTMNGVYSDTLEVDWRGGNDNSSVRPTESVLLYLAAFLLLKSNLY